MAQYTVRRRESDGVNCIYLADYAVVIAEFVGNSRKDAENIGRLLDSVPQLLEALDLIERIADFEGGKLTPEEWEKHLAPFQMSSEVSMIYVMDAIQAIAYAALQTARREEAE